MERLKWWWWGVGGLGGSTLSPLSGLDFLPQKTRGAEQVAGAQRAAPAWRSGGDPAELALESLPDGGAARKEAAGDLFGPFIWKELRQNWQRLSSRYAECHHCEATADCVTQPGSDFVAFGSNFSGKFIFYFADFFIIQTC